MQWILGVLRFHEDKLGQWEHPSGTSNSGSNAFLTHLAVGGKVTAGTYNQALSALLFRFRTALQSKVEVDAVRAKKSARMPVVLSVDEVRRVLEAIPAGPYRLIAGLMYGGQRTKHIPFLATYLTRVVQLIAGCW